jgi:hypothetical protein
VHVPKTGGTAIERTLLGGTNVPMGGHTTALGFRSKYPEVFHDYFKFAVIREPVDRFVSAFCYLRQEPVHMAHNNALIHECDTLECFAERLRTEPTIIQSMVHLLPQHRFICDHNGQILVDAVYRYHDLDRAWRDICERLGVSHAPLPRMNISRQRPAAKPPTGLVELVASLYEADYSFFGL